MEILGISVIDGKPKRLTIENGKIAKAGTVSTADPLPFISHGFLDMQLNGYRGIDYSLESLKTEDIAF